MPLNTQTINFVQLADGKVQAIAGGDTAFDTERYIKDYQVTHNGFGEIQIVLKNAFGEETFVVVQRVTDVSFEGVPCADFAEFEFKTNEMFFDYTIL